MWAGPEWLWCDDYFMCSLHNIMQDLQFVGGGGGGGGGLTHRFMQCYLIV